ncbi:50S ribosomal protein L15e [archaeon]|nr:50S ribosomal protein L15e [archaeon]MBT4648685.1 50S ribosomal protein L15e [archaeon]MBT6821809.1 50S ribosomal protein L15e [archaeon]MBT7393083.1 50S ribosomal protein L15e [archaeon]
MGMYKYIKNVWKKPKENLNELWKERLVSWRKQPVSVRIEKPTRLDKARKLGYKAKPGYLIVRQRVIRGGHTRPTIRKGRKSKRRTNRQVVGKNYQQICEERANKKHMNCEVLNSYYVAKEGRYIWYEVILVDKSHPVIKSDKKINWITEPQHRGRVFRGITSPARKSRGLRKKGKGAEKARPSLRANKRRMH